MRGIEVDMAKVAMKFQSYFTGQIAYVLESVEFVRSEMLPNNLKLLRT